MNAKSRRPFLHGWRGRLLAVAFGFAVLAVAELVCVLLGWGKATDCEDPFVGFSEIHPLFVKDIGGERFVVAPSRRKFFPPESFPARKPPAGFRIFCLGGSTVQGNPYSLETSFTTWLELALKAADPSRDWDVVNCGGISYASYRLAPILRECLAYQPDLFIVCTGENEFLEDRTYEHVKRAPRLLSTLEHAAARLRTCTVLRAGVLKLRERMAQAGRPRTDDPAAESTQAPRSLNGAGSVASRWPRSGERSHESRTSPRQADGRPVMTTEVDPWLDYSGGLKIYHRDEEWQRGVIAHFENNLRRMVALACDAGVPVVFVKPMSNLRDCPPFKSEHRAGLTEIEQRKWEQLSAQAAGRAKSDPREAIELLQEAARLDDRFAATFYALGKCYEALEQAGPAREAFQKARELDVCPLRILQPMADTLARVAAETGALLVDAHELLERRSRLGILGDDWMLDHVHPSIPGHQAIADALISGMEQRRWVKPRTNWTAACEGMWQQHLASLSGDYFRAGEIALDGLRAWTQGRASGPAIEYRVIAGGLSAPQGGAATR